MKKLRSKKGFTLMEMLIVVAIIAILVAITIPSFSSSLNKARLATDESEIRADYAELMIDFMEAGSDEAKSSDGYKCTANNTEGVTIAGVSSIKWSAGDTIYVHINEDGDVTIDGTASSTP